MVTKTTDHSNLLERTKTYHDIKWRLRQQLGTQWGPGVRLPPIKTLARKLKTGQTNTHRAIKELVSEGLLVSRPGQGTFVTPKVEVDPLWSPAATAPAGAHSAVLDGKWVEVLTYASEPDGFIRKAIEAFHAQLSRHGCRVTRAVVRHHAADLAEHDKADAVLVINPESTAQIQTAPNQALSVISTGIDLALTTPSGYDVVYPDSHQGSILAGQHLRAIGCTTAMFIGCNPTPEQTRQYDLTSTIRLGGFELGFGEAIPPERRLHCEHYMSTDGARAVATFLQLSPRPDAVFAASDELAIGFIHGALAHGLLPGRDYQIIGFDSQQRGRELTTGALTSVEVPMKRMGELAATLLIQRLLDPQRTVHRIMLGCTLFEGTTTRAK